MTCPAYRSIPTGIFAPPEEIHCVKPEGHKGPHQSAWITGTRINELTQTQSVRVFWKDKRA